MKNIYPKLDLLIELLIRRRTSGDSHIPNFMMLSITYKDRYNETDDITNDDFNLLFEKLIEDGYAEYDHALKPKIKANGVLFDGYVNQINANEAESLRISDLEKNSYRVSVWVAIGAVGVLLMEVLKLLHGYYCH